MVVLFSCILSMMVDYVGLILGGRAEGRGYCGCVWKECVCSGRFCLFCVCCPCKMFGAFCVYSVVCPAIVNVCHDRVLARAVHVSGRSVFHKLCIRFFFLLALFVVQMWPIVR